MVIYDHIDSFEFLKRFPLGDVSLSRHVAS